MRNVSLRLLHLLRDLAAQPNHRHDDLIVALAKLNARARYRLPARVRIRFEVLVHDAPARSGAVHEAKLDAEIPGVTANGGRRDRTFVGGAWHWRGHRRDRCG